MKEKTNYNLLRIVALIALVVGALASVVIVLYKSQHNNSVLLRLLFVFWVLGPFAGLLLMKRISGPWKAMATSTLYILMLVVAVGSLISYSGVLIPQRTKPAFIFLVLPVVCWFVIMIAVIVSRSGQDRNL